MSCAYEMKNMHLAKKFGDRVGEGGPEALYFALGEAHAVPAQLEDETSAEGVSKKEESAWFESAGGRDADEMHTRSVGGAYISAVEVADEGNSEKRGARGWASRELRGIGWEDKGGWGSWSAPCTGSSREEGTCR